MICAFALDIVDRYRSFDGAGGWRIQMAENFGFRGFADLPRHACYWCHTNLLSVLSSVDRQTRPDG